MKHVIGLSAIVFLAGCGVDGEPVPPGEEQPQVETDTSVVLSAGSHGAGAAVATTVRRGNVSITLGTGF